MQTHHAAAVPLVDEQLEKRVRRREIADGPVACERLKPQRESEAASGGQPEHADREHAEAGQQVSPMLRPRVAPRGEMQRGDHRTDAGRRDQQSVPGGARVEDLLGEDGNQDRVLQAEPTDDPEEDEQVAQRGLVAHVVEARQEPASTGDGVSADRLTRLRRMERSAASTAR